MMIDNDFQRSHLPFDAGMATGLRVYLGRLRLLAQILTLNFVGLAVFEFVSQIAFPHSQVFAAIAGLITSLTAGLVLWPYLWPTKTNSVYSREIEIEMLTIMMALSMEGLSPEEMLLVFSADGFSAERFSVEQLLSIEERLKIMRALSVEERLKIMRALSAGGRLSPIQALSVEERTRFIRALSAVGTIKPMPHSQ